MAMSDDTRKSMLILRAEGVSDSIIGRAFGVSKQAVHGTLGARDPAVPRLTPRKAKVMPDMPALANDLDKALPMALYAWRNRRNLTQTDAARLVKVDPNVWSTWERGSRTCALPGVLLNLLDTLDKIDGIEK